MLCGSCQGEQEVALLHYILSLLEADIILRGQYAVDLARGKSPLYCGLDKNAMKRVNERIGCVRIPIHVFISFLEIHTRYHSISEMFKIFLSLMFLSPSDYSSIIRGWVQLQVH